MSSYLPRCVPTLMGPSFRESQYTSGQGLGAWSSHFMGTYKNSPRKELIGLTYELSVYKQQLMKQKKTMTKLVTHRNNNRVLVEHLDHLASLHEHILFKRWPMFKLQISERLRNEHEVLNSILAVYESHEKLDEEVRKQLNEAIDKYRLLEEQVHTKPGEVHESLKVKSPKCETSAHLHVEDPEKKSLRDSQTVPQNKITQEPDSTKSAPKKKGFWSMFSCFRQRKTQKC